MLLPAVFFILFLVLLFAWLIAEKTTKHKEIINENKKEYMFSMFFPIAFAILGLFGLNEENAADRKGIIKKRKEKQVQQFRILYGEMEYKKHYWLYLADIASGIYITVILSLFLMFVVSFQEAKNASDFKTKMERPEYGRTKTYNVVAEFESKDEVVQKDVELVIEGRLPDEQEAKAIIEAEKEQLLKYMLNSNSDLKSIVGDLRFPARNESKGIDIEWVTSNPVIIGRDGNVANADLESPVEVTITAVLSIGDVYTDTMETTVTVLPGPKGAAAGEANNGETKVSFAERVEMIVAEINEKINADLSDTTVQIPEKVDEDIEISWFTKEKSKLPFIVLIALMFGAVLIYYFNMKNKEKLDEHKDRIKMDFPEMLNKLVLLVGAGTTVSTAMDKIISDYKLGNEKRSLYEELITLNESIYGDKKMSYEEAYEAFAKRCMVPEAIRFAALMIQHEKTGSSNLVSMLKLFSTEAWQERKRIAERRGKMAENKLLVPILLMFLAILIIVLMPITTMMQI